MNWIKKDVASLDAGPAWVAGSQTWLSLKTVAPNAWKEVTLNVSYQSRGGGLYIHLDPWYLAIEEAQGRMTLSKYLGGNFFEAWDIDLEPEAWTSVEMKADSNSVTITVNGRSFSYASSVATPMTSAALHFSEGCRFREPQIQVSEFEDVRILPADDGSLKSLDVTIDFHDDLQGAAFDHRMLLNMFGAIAGIGASRAYWIHHGKRGNGFWEGGTGVDNIERSFASLGDDFLPPAVQAAHASGLSLIGIFKPFDTAILHATVSGPGNRSAAPALGGTVEMSFDFPAQHPELCMQRHHEPQRGKCPDQIVIRSRKQLPVIEPGQIEIYTSADNATYELYCGPFEIATTSREIRLTGLAIETEFVALSFAPKLAAQIQNTLPLLAEVRASSGEVLEFTYGIAPRLQWVGEFHLAGAFEYRDFRKHGLNFDCASHGVPNAVWNSNKRMVEPYSPVSSHNVLGLALNANRHVPAVLSEAEPGAQAWWLSRIEEMLDAGVDGVEIRLMNHSNIIDWSQFGFNQPLIDEYQRLHGIDITKEDFSREKFRALRGEFFTRFLREASRLVRARGKKFYLHIEDAHQGPASEPCPMEIAMPWRQWIEEEICDGVTLKALSVWANDTAFGREVIAACNAKGMPISFSPFIHTAFASEQRDEILISFLANAYDAFNVYEFATLFKFNSQGEVEIVDQAMIDWLESYQ